MSDTYVPPGRYHGSGCAVQNTLDHRDCNCTAGPDAPRVARLKESYEQKVADLARETRRVSAALEACAKRGIKSPRYVVGEAGIGWDAAMEYVEKAIRAAGEGAEGAEGAEIDE